MWYNVVIKIQRKDNLCQKPTHPFCLTKFLKTKKAKLFHNTTSLNSQKALRKAFFKEFSQPTHAQSNDDSIHSLCEIVIILIKAQKRVALLKHKQDERILALADEFTHIVDEFIEHKALKLFQALDDNPLLCLEKHLARSKRVSVDKVL